jgi:Arc/MetJ family transcription regulator
MKKTLNIEDDLLKEAKEACGATTDTETVRKGLEALVRHAAYQKLRELAGSEPDAEDAPRRRDWPAVEDKVA